MPSLFKTKYYLVSLILLVSLSIKAQDVAFVIPDSLNETSYSELLSKYSRSYRDTLKSKIYLNTYYKKAILDDDDLKKSTALGHISYYAESYEAKIEIVTLAIHYAKKSKTSSKLMQMYTLAGGYYYLKPSYDKALEFYFKSLTLAEEIKSDDYIYINKHQIAIIKGDIGNYKESVKLLKECYDREVEIGNKSYLYDYLSSTLYLSEAFIRNKQFDSASFYIEKVISKAKEEFPDIANKARVYQNITSNKEILKDYNNLCSSISILENESPNSNRILVIGNYHSGLMSEKLGFDKSNIHFRKVDSIYRKNNIYIPEIRFSFEHLIKYHKRKNQFKEQLHYVDELLKFDSIYNQQKNDLGAKIFNNYDTPILLSEKEQLIKSLDNKNETLIYGASILVLVLLILIILAIFLFRRNKLLKNRFNKAISKTTEKDNPDQGKEEVLKHKKKKRELTISPKIVEEVLKNLSEFESKKGFITRNLTADSLAKKVGTNYKYLSQIINYHKNKSVSSYINDLRIEYTINLLKSDSKIMNYTIQSIAEDVGFNNAESFSKAFFKNTGIKPSYFIKHLKIN